MYVPYAIVPYGHRYACGQTRSPRHRTVVSTLVRVKSSVTKYLGLIREQLVLNAFPQDLDGLQMQTRF
ncbi:hypothetical protein IEO21_02727 [Rhodonia placenta]|uniref:Uncharacterized protein n=1 Tax=Rhodonia placenta TaxID=104341 RepID=A0A8H7P710_9APHY|nr:hypothetical protein IEO21_02727 [Postia placenta]